MIANHSLLGFFYKQVEPTPCWEPVFSDKGPLPMFSELFISLLRSKSLVIVASSNGYLLCHNPNEARPGCGYYVINPFSEQRVDLPSPLEPPTSPYSIGFECQVNPNASPCAMARFSVVLANLIDVSHTNLGLNVFSSEQFKWTKLILCDSNKYGPVQCRYKLGSTPAIVYNGVYYWFYHIHMVGSYGYGDNKRRYLIAFDQPSSQIRTIAIPPIYSKYGLRFLVAITTRNFNYNLWKPSDDHKMLCVNDEGLFYGVYDRKNKVVSVYGHFGNYHYKDCESWDLQYTVDFQEMETKNPDLFIRVTSGDSDTSIMVKGFYPRNPRIFFFMFDGKLMSYEADGELVIVHTNLDNNLAVNGVGVTNSIDNRWVAYEWWSWPCSLPKSGDRGGQRESAVWQKIKKRWNRSLKEGAARPARLRHCPYE